VNFVRSGKLVLAIRGMIIDE